MDLFTRNVLMVGSPAAYLAFATEMRAYVSDKLGQDVSLWSVGFGAPAGSLVYSMQVDGLAGVQANNAVLLGDADYIAKITAHQDMVGAPAEDNLGQPIHGEVGASPPAGAVATVTRAVIANGAYAEAVGWGVEMAQLSESIMGTPTVFSMNAFGTFGTVSWVNIAADAAAADAAGQAVNANSDYVNALSAVGDLFVPGSGHRSVAVKVA